MKAPKGHDLLDEGEIVITLRSMLGRRRRLVPFPVPMLDAYWALFPQAFRTIMHNPSINASPHMTKKEEGDFYRALNVHRALTENIRIVVEFIGKPDRAFYMTFDGPMYAPDAISHGVIVVPPDYVYFKEVEEWVEAATSMDARHELLLTATQQFIRAARSRDTLRQSWPTLAGILKITGPFHPIAPVTMAHLDHVLPSAQRKHIDEQIASCLMLEPYEPKAWSGYGPMGGE